MKFPEGDALKRTVGMAYSFYYFYFIGTCG